MSADFLVGGYLEPFEWETIVFKSAMDPVHVMVWSKHCQWNRSRQNFGFSTLVTASNICEFDTSTRYAELK